jgi:filamentous hemagglutinin family protein
MKIWPSVSLGLCLALLGGVSYGQAPPPITSSGLNTQISAPVTLPGGAVQHNITGGTRPGGGANLFHSFGEFGVPSDNVATFLNDSALPTTNILSRVTGGNPSNIFGTIQTQGFGNANLFLMNPAGIVFGPNASLNVGGAAHFTTADYLRLSDGVQFTAMPSAQDALLSVAPVAAFGFLESNPASILVDGSTLSVEEGQTISLVGGDITIGSGLNALGGKIALASVASPGEVLADTYGNAPNINGQSFTTMGNIVLSEGATLNVSADAAGTVFIRGGQLMMTNATISANTGDSSETSVAVYINVAGNISIFSDTSSAITAKTTGAGDPGEIRIEGGTLETFSNLPFGVAMIDSHTSGSGKGGNVNIRVENLRVNGNPLAPDLFIQTGTAGPGAGGDISITSGTGSFVNTSIDAGVTTLGGSGSGGNLTLKGDRLTIDGSGFGTDSFDEKGGNITLQAADLELINNTNITTFSLQGDNAVVIQADRFVLTDNSSILSATALGPGNGVTITGSVVEFHNGSAVTSQTFGDGNAGPIRVNASDHVSFTDDPNTSFPSGLFTSSFGDQGLGEMGNAGAVEITTPRLEISGGARITTETKSGGRGGDVSITATENISIIGGRDFGIPGEVFGSGRASGIYTRTLGSDFCGGGPCGPAGNISITTGSMNVADGAVLDSGTTNTGNSGTISVNASNHISIAGILEDGLSDDGTLDEGGPGGVFSRTIGTNSGNGGNISLIAGESFFLKDGASVSSSTDGLGQAGAIAIDVTAGSFSIAQGAVVNSGTTGTGAGGAITIHASDNISITGILNEMRSGVLSQTSGAGAGGTISLMAGQNFTLSDGATVSASSDGPGNAGNIKITATDTILIDKATVTTEAVQASGGNITLTANEMIQLVDSTIESNVKGDATTVAGNIKLDPDFIILQNSHILAKAVAGKGGNIDLVASKAVLLDAQSTLDASSQTGISGSVRIESPIQVLSGTIAPLPDQPVNVATLYASRCVAGEGGHFSTFVDSKSDSVAPTPGTFLASPFLPQGSSSSGGAVRHADTPAGIAGTGHAAPIQVAAYATPVLFQHGDGMLSACP